MIEETMTTLKLKPGTIVHICGWPVELTTETEVASSPGNIELVTRDLYLRRNEPLTTSVSDGSTHTIR